MYDWLGTATDGSSLVLTANRRLARTLRTVHAEQQLTAGQLAWQTPDIVAWQDWARLVVERYSDPGLSRIVISPYHSKMLWEKCLRREVSDPLLNFGALARVARDTYQRLEEWCVPLAEVQRYARSRDQRVFATVAKSYRSILEREGWADLPTIIRQAIEFLRDKQGPPMEKVTLAGFDRVSPRLQTLLDAFTESGVQVLHAAEQMQDKGRPQRGLSVAENSDAEFRAAGAWARQCLIARPDARVAIIVSELERDAQRCARLIQEGLLPGWQYSQQDLGGAINISYGRKLNEYPVIADALLVLNWLHRDLPTLDICRLLRAATMDEGYADARVRHDLALRQFPEQGWSAAHVLEYLDPARENRAAELRFLRAIARVSGELPQRQSPGAWVSLFSELLGEVGWPGTSPLGSEQFQTVNRWRELLNEVARLELITKTMTLGEIIAHLYSLAAETLFQPEGQDASVNVLGPLEAAGLEFDAIRVTGMTSANWPPQGNALPLLSRELQRNFAMPDATPADSLAYAERVLTRLAGSAATQVFSYPQTQGDAELSMSGLLESLELGEAQAASDPDWFAKSIANTAIPEIVVSDPVPRFLTDESLLGGASTVQLQFVEPFAAFVTGRLGVRRLFPVEPGLPANIRGSLIHGALQKLYQSCPTQTEIQGWDDAVAEQRRQYAVSAAFLKLERHADATLVAVLQYEKQRVSELLKDVIALDIEREPFAITAVEQLLEGTIAELPLRLRVDRIDQDRQGKLIIIDYKSGAPKRLLGADGLPKDMQLVVYAYVAARPVAGIALLNIDARGVALDAVGEAFPAKTDLSEALPAWFAAVEKAANEIVGGDVRISALQTVTQARPLALLSRFRELQLER